MFASKPIIAKPLSVKKVQGYLLNALKQTEDDAKERAHEIVDTFKHQKIIHTGIRYAGGDAYVYMNIRVIGDDGSDIYRFLDEGTLVKWALFSEDWRNKTIANGPYKSGVGAGRRIIAGRQAMQKRGIPAQRGIQARNWTSRLDRDLSIVLAFRIDYALEQGLK